MSNLNNRLTQLEKQHPPAKILAEADIDISSAKFWQGGFDVLSRMVDELEKIPAGV